jgi:hypothetical protein
MLLSLIKTYVNFCALITIAGEPLPDESIQDIFQKFDLVIWGTREIDTKVTYPDSTEVRVPALQFLALSYIKSLDVPALHTELSALDEVMGVSVAEQNPLDFVDLDSLSTEGNA